MIKPNAEYQTLVLLDLPDGTRTVFFASTPQSLQMGETLVVFESSLGWKTGETENNPAPGRQIVTRAAGNLRLFGVKAELPWVVYCQTRPE